MNVPERVFILIIGCSFVFAGMWGIIRGMTVGNINGVLAGTPILGTGITLMYSSLWNKRIGKL